MAAGVAASPSAPRSLGGARSPPRWGPLGRRAAAGLAPAVGGGPGARVRRRAGAGAARRGPREGHARRWRGATAAVEHDAASGERGGVGEVVSEWANPLVPQDLPKSAVLPEEIVRNFYTRFPRRIVLVRHGQSLGNVQPSSYTVIPDHAIPLTREGYQQALAAGEYIKGLVESDGPSAHVHLYMSPYRRSVQTADGIATVFPSGKIRRKQQDVQLREQDFGNFQDLTRQDREMRERLRFGRFYFRFPNGESGADVYDRITGFQDHLVRDITTGRFSGSTSLVLVTHGLALRVFLMRWFHLEVEEFLQVYNPNNAKPIVLERDVPNALCMLDQKVGVFQKEDLPMHFYNADSTSPWRHTKSLYRMSSESISQLGGLTRDMCGGCCGEQCIFEPGTKFMD